MNVKHLLNVNQLVNMKHPVFHLKSFLSNYGLNSLQTATQRVRLNLKICDIIYGSNSLLLH